MTTPSPRSPAGRTPRLGILHVASEAAPWAKTGGLADVLSGLPEALDRQGHHVTVVVPRYRGVTLPDGERTKVPLRFGGLSTTVTIHTVALSPRRRVAFVEAPAWFDREGLYGSAGRDFPDNAQRFGLLAYAALEFAQQDTAGRRFDIVHAHDWQAGLVPALIKTQPARWTRVARAGLVCTIHNLAYQGLFPREVVPELGLDWQVFTMEAGEFWGRLSFLKCGIAYSDVITTVSPAYARETRRPEFGFGFEGTLQARADRYVGILNGIDTLVWDPASDRYLPAHFGVDDLSGKRLCKRALLERFQLPVGDDALSRPVIGMVSRLVDQKGFDLVEAAAERLMELDASWVVVGSGDARYEHFFRSLAARYPARVAVHVGFDESLAHLVEAGADVFLMPSRFEPCGLNQMYSLRYGTVPVVRAVGGLDDTIQLYTARARRANGFKFRDATPEALFRAVRQAVRLYRHPDLWARLVRQGMSEDHSWDKSAREYVKVYRRARYAAAERWAD